jgi:hypothetical protein
VSLPLPLRNRLSELIVDSLHDPHARRALQALAALCADPTALGVGELPEQFPLNWFESRQDTLRLKGAWKEHAAELGNRARQAWHALRARPLDPPDPPLGAVLDAAALLFDAGLYFEVHELLEPHWMRAGGTEREALQGLIQIAVGFQHLANHNLMGARALLGEGCQRIRGRQLERRELDAFEHGTRRCLTRLGEETGTATRSFDWSSVPPFPARV